MKKLAFFLVLLSGVCWGSVGIFIRSLNGMGLATMQIVEIRSMFTSGLLIIFLAIFSPRLLKIKIKDIWCFVGGGVGSIILFNYCYFQTIQHSSLSIAAVLLYTSPIFVMIISAFLFKERLTIKKTICLFTTFIGCALVCGIASGAQINGSIFVTGLLSGFGYALYSIFSRFALLRGYHPLTITAYIFLFGAIGGIPLTDFTELSLGFKDVESIIYLIFFAAVTTLIPYIAYTSGLKYIENGVASVSSSVEPVTATIFGFAFFAETPDLYGFIGIVLVVVSVLVLNFSKKEKM